MPLSSQIKWKKAAVVLIQCNNALVAVRIEWVAVRLAISAHCTRSTYCFPQVYTVQIPVQCLQCDKVQFIHFGSNPPSSFLVQSCKKYAVLYLLHYIFFALQHALHWCAAHWSALQHAISAICAYALRRSWATCNRFVQLVCIAKLSNVQ